MSERPTRPAPPPRHRPLPDDHERARYRALRKRTAPLRRIGKRALRVAELSVALAFAWGVVLLVGTAAIFYAVFQWITSS